MKRFLKKLFLIRDFHLPPIRLKLPNWRTPEINLRVPGFGGWQPPNLRVASLNGLRITGGIWKVGTWGLGLRLLVTGFAIGTSVVFTQAAPHFPDPAIYNVAAVKPDHTLKVGQEWQFEDATPAAERELKSNTLLINMSGARAGLISLTGLDIGATFGSTTSTIKIIGGTGKILEADECIFSNITATEILIANSQFHTFNILNNEASGISIGGTLSSTPADIVVQSERNVASIPSVANGTFDKIEINTATASSQLKKLVISDVQSYGGGIAIDNLHCGTFTLQNSKFGKDADLSTFELTIAATTLYKVGTFTGNVEKTIIVK